MTKKIKTIITCFAIACTLGVGAFVGLHTQNAQAVSLQTEENVLQRYVVGDRLVVPSGKLTVDGKEYDATASVLFPDGKAYSAAEVVLEQSGTHVVKYTATVDGKIYREEVTFEVNKEIFSVDGNNSTFSHENGRVSLDLAEKEEFTYNVPVDLKNMTKDDAFLSVFVTAGETGVRDFEEYVIKLTDAYEEENALFIRVRAANDYEEYVANPDQYGYLAYTEYQAYVGVNFNDHGEWVGNEFNKIYRGEYFGTPVGHSFVNKPYNGASLEEDALRFCYDYESKSIYVGSLLYGGIVADLDAKEYFTDGWKGFTDGLCYISVYANEVTNTAKLVLKDIAGLDGSESLVYDEDAPEIQIDFDGYKENSLPYGVKGKPYKVFEATALDKNIVDKTANCKVYYNYGATNKTLIEVKDGAFVPEYEGIYTLVYSAEDTFGNKAEKAITVSVAEYAEALALDVSDGQGVAGVMASVSAPALSSYDERTGMLRLCVTLSQGETDEEIFNGLFEDFQGADYCFMRTGAWTVSYTLSDYSRSVEKSVVYTVSAEKNVIFDKFEDLAMDKYFVSGNTYVLPNVRVASFTDTQTVYADARIKAVYGDGAEETLEGNLFTPDAQKGDKVEIVYFDGSDESVRISGTKDIYSITNENGIDMSKLFVSDKAEISAEQNSVRAKMTEDSSIALINKQDAQNFTMDFNLFERSGSFDEFSVILTDSADADVAVKLTFKNLHNTEFMESGNVHMYVNGNSQKTYPLQYSFNELSAMRFSVSYKNVVSTLTVEETSFKIEECLNGAAFNGFPSKAVYLTFESELTGEGEAEFYMINAQRLSKAVSDGGKPRTTLNTPYSSAYRVGEVITTSTAFGIDVLGGYNAPTVTVTHYESGETLKTVDGTPIEKLDATVAHEIKLDTYGEYLIRYYSEDRFGNASSATYSFYVEDVTVPTIEIVGEVKKVVRVGDKFTAPAVATQDDATQALEVFAVIKDPDGKGVYVALDGEYTFMKKGTHQVVLCVFDGNGNLATTAYYVEVV